MATRRFSLSTTVVAPLPVVDYMARNARTAHARTFELLASPLAGEP